MLADRRLTLRGRSVRVGTIARLAG